MLTPRLNENSLAEPPPTQYLYRTNAHCPLSPSRPVCPARRYAILILLDVPLASVNVPGCSAPLAQGCPVTSRFLCSRRFVAAIPRSPLPAPAPSAPLAARSQVVQSPSAPVPNQCTSNGPLFRVRVASDPYSISPGFGSGSGFGSGFGSGSGVGIGSGTGPGYPMMLHE